MPQLVRSAMLMSSLIAEPHASSLRGMLQIVVSWHGEARGRASGCWDRGSRVGLGRCSVHGRLVVDGPPVVRWSSREPGYGVVKLT